MRRQPRKHASVLGAVEGLVSVRGLWEVPALSASVRVQRLRPLGHINPGAIGWHAGLGGSVPVGMGRFETGKVPVVWFPVLFLYCSGLVRNLISITRRSSSFAMLTGTSAATLLRPLSTALLGIYGIR